MKKPRVVIDTNVWLSGLVFGGQPGEVLKLFAEGSVIVVTCEEALSELRRKVIQKFSLFSPYLDLLEASIRKDGELVYVGSQPVTVCRDPDDNMFLETAIIGHCQYIVSGDHDLLTLKNYKNIKIIKPSDFLKIIHP